MPTVFELFAMANATTRRLNAAIFNPVLPIGERVEYVRKTDASRISESAHQQALIKWWAAVCANYSLPESVLMASQAQGQRTKKNASRLKAEGMRAGQPDLLLAVSRHGSHGLWVEMKTEIGRLTDSQKEFLKMVSEQGYATAVCRGAGPARAVIEKYLA